jgi:hypothetical protein
MFDVPGVKRRTLKMVGIAEFLIPHADRKIIRRPIRRRMGDLMAGFSHIHDDIDPDLAVGVALIIDVAGADGRCCEKQGG